MHLSRQLRRWVNPKEITLKRYDSMGFESEHGIWVRAVDADERIRALEAEQAEARSDLRKYGGNGAAAIMEMVALRREKRDAQERIRELEAALREIADFAEQFIADDEDGDERMYRVHQIADNAIPYTGPVD